MLKISGTATFNMSCVLRNSRLTFNISRVLGHVHSFWELTFSISRVLSNFCWTCLTFPGCETCETKIAQNTGNVKGCLPFLGNMANMLDVFRAMNPYGPISEETFHMFRMLNISYVLSHVKDFWTATFNISCVWSNLRLTCLTFPGF